MTRVVLLAVVATVFAATLGAQDIQTINTNRPGGASDGAVFMIGPRLSNYSTDFEGGLDSLKTGRQNAFGVVGEYRNGNFVIDFNYDHDPENGIRLTDIIVDPGNYARDRTEVAVGIAIAPVLDIQGGLRFDTIRIGGSSFFGNPFGHETSIDHQAIVAGIKLHTGEGQPAGFYLLGRGMIGTTKFDVLGGNVDDDSTGFRVEAGVNIRVGDTNWMIVPGAEYEHIETSDFDVRLNTNRLFLNFVYRTGM